jgi:hypothetical protein
MDPNYVLHALPSQREERSDKWAWPLIATKKKVNQNEAIFNFLEHISLILNEWAISSDGKDYMKLEPNLSTEIESMENEGDGRKKEVGGNKPFVGKKGKMAKNAAPPRKREKVTPPSKAKWESCANFLLFLKKFKIQTHWVLFDVHVDKFNGYQEFFQFLVTAAQVSEVEKPHQCTPLGWQQFKCEVLVGTMCKCCEDANWREHAVKTCSLKIWDAMARHPDFVNQSDKTKEIELMLSSSKCKVSPINGILALPANLNKSFYYSLIEHLLHELQHHHQSLMKGFHEWCISQYGTVDGGQKDCSQTQARWSKGYALHEELYGCCAFLEYLLLCHTNKWTPTKAHAHLKTHIPHISDLTANELVAVVLWCNLQYCM